MGREARAATDAGGLSAPYGLKGTFPPHGLKGASPRGYFGAENGGTGIYSGDPQC